MSAPASSGNSGDLTATTHPHQQASDLSVVFEGTSLLSGERILIDNATGIVRAGRLAAIVSACGSRGDLLMLRLLAGLEEPASGSIVANCVPVSSNTYLENAAFVRTSVAPVPIAGAELTVLDNLEFSLRMRSSLTSEDAHTRIERVLWQLQLQDVTDCKVSALSANDQVKLSIASELLLRPDFVYIDFALGDMETPYICDLLHLLGEIARDEKIVVAVALVQPRWIFLEYFHDVLLMEHSRLYYCGTREALLPLLYEAEMNRPNSFSGPDTMGMNSMLMTDDNNNNHQHQQQQNSNNSAPQSPQVADPRLASSTPASSLRHPESCLNSLYILCASTRPSDLLEPPGFAAARSRANDEVASVLRETANGRVKMYDRLAPNVAPNFVVKLFFMMLNGLFRAKQGFLKLLLGLVVAFVSFLLVGKLYGNVMTNDDDDGGNSAAGGGGGTGGGGGGGGHHSGRTSTTAETTQNGTGLLFFAVSLAFLYNILHIEPFREELASFQQHRRQGYYGGALFLVWLVLSNALTRTLFCMVVLLGVYLIDPLLGLAKLNHLVIVLGMVSFCTLALAWAVIAVFPNSKQLTVVVFVATYGVSALFGGLFINLLSLPESLRSISMISLIRLGFESAIVGQFSGNDLGCNATVTTTTTTTTAAPHVETTTPVPQPPIPRLLHILHKNNLDHRTGGQQEYHHGSDFSEFYQRKFGVGSYLGTCMTGDAYIASVGFDSDRKWANLEYITYILLVMLAVTAFGLFYHRKVSL